MPLRWVTSLANFWLAMSCVMIALVQIGVAHAAEFTTAAEKSGQTVLLLDGRIELGDSIRLALIVTALDNQNRAVSALYLNSPGGSGDDARVMAALVKRFNISTIVADGAKCASACFTVFAAGHEKFAGDRTQIGVHRSSSEDGKESSFSYAATFETARTVGELGVPAAIVGKLVLTPPHEMAWLSPDDLRSMNVAIVGLLRWPLPSTPPLPVVPLQLTLFKAAVKPEGLSWPQYVAATSELARRQLPDTFRDACNLYTMLCSRSFKFIDKDELRVEVATVEDLSGNVVRREVCKYDTGPAVRSCFDWDTLETSHAAKDNDGQWKSVIGKRY